MTQKRKRWSSIDVLRVVSFLLILFYHFMVEIENGGYFFFASYGMNYENSNLHIAKIGVVLFFMMSGFGLMAGSGGEFSLNEYGKKRFLRILVPYYVVSLIVFVCALIFSKESVFEESIPIWRLIFTALGLDGYVREYGVLTFHLGVGEWFIGCLVLMYLVFPLLRRAFQKKPDISIGIATICYLLILLFYNGEVPVYYFFPVKLYDFLLGMYLASKLKTMSWKTSVFAGILLVLLWMTPFRLPLNEDLPNVIFSVLLFLCVFCLESIDLVKRVFECRIFRWIADSSYEMFLIHHWVIIMMNRMIQPETVVEVCICFVVELMVIFFGGGILHFLLKRVISS